LNLRISENKNMRHLICFRGGSSLSFAGKVANWKLTIILPKKAKRSEAKSGKRLVASKSKIRDISRF
jgi:hypothetical protein